MKTILIAIATIFLLSLVYIGYNYISEPTNPIDVYGKIYTNNIKEKKITEQRIIDNCKKDTSKINILIECTKKMKQVEANQIINDAIYNNYLK